MRFSPRTEEQVTRLLKSGVWKYEVVNAEECISKTSNLPMFTLTIKCWDEDGRQSVVTDYIVFTDAFEWKLRHFCKSNLLADKYETGEIFAHDCIGQAGECKGAVEKDKTGKYPDKNKIADYLMLSEEDIKNNKTITQSFEEDSDIPF